MGDTGGLVPLPRWPVIRIDVEDDGTVFVDDHELHLADSTDPWDAALEAAASRAALLELGRPVRVEVMLPDTEPRTMAAWPSGEVTSEVTYTSSRSLDGLPNHIYLAAPPLSPIAAVPAIASRPQGRPRLALLATAAVAAIMVAGGAAAVASAAGTDGGRADRAAGLRHTRLLSPGKAISRHPSTSPTAPISAVPRHRRHQTMRHHHHPGAAGPAAGPAPPVLAPQSRPSPTPSLCWYTDPSGSKYLEPCGTNPTGPPPAS